MWFSSVVLAGKQHRLCSWNLGLCVSAISLLTMFPYAFPVIFFLSLGRHIRPNIPLYSFTFPTTPLLDRRLQTPPPFTFSPPALARNVSIQLTSFPFYVQCLDIPFILSGLRSFVH